MTELFSDIYAFLAKGGILMIPVAACSVVALAFFLERLWRLQRRKVIPERFLEVVSDLFEEGKYEEARSLCRTNPSPIASMLKNGIERRGESRSDVKEAMRERGESEVYELERFVNALGAISTVSPLLGLLGTVTGMIEVFQGVVTQASSGGAVDAAVLANGIWEALITTAAGLAVAIPTYLGYRYILGRIDGYAVELEDICLGFVDELSDASTPPADTEDADASDSEGEQKEESQQ